MQVQELVTALETVTPTLGPPDIGVPLMSHYWFTGEHVLTYDDHLAMQAPCPSIGAKLTISGRLLPLLKASYQKAEVKITYTDKDVTVHMGRSKTTLPSFGIMEANLLFKMPKLLPNENTFTGKLERARLAIEACKLSIDEGHPQRNGITIIPEEGMIALYSFNNDSLTRCTLAGDFAHRIMLPTPFWNNLLALTGKKAGEKPQVTVLLQERRALAKVKGVMLFAKCVEVMQPTDLRKLYDTHFTSVVQKRLAPITAEIQEAITRAAVLSKDDHAAKTVLQVTNGVLHVLTDSLHGHGNEKLKFDHPDTPTVSVRAQSLLNALERFSSDKAKLGIAKRVVALQEADRVHLLSGTG